MTQAQMKLFNLGYKLSEHKSYETWTKENKIIELNSNQCWKNFKGSRNTIPIDFTFEEMEICLERMKELRNENNERNN